MTTNADWKKLKTYHFAQALFARDDWKKAIKDCRNRFIINGAAEQRRQHIKYALMLRKLVREQ